MCIVCERDGVLMEDRCWNIVDRSVLFLSVCVCFKDQIQAARLMQQAPTEPSLAPEGFFVVLFCFVPPIWNLVQAQIVGGITYPKSSDVVGQYLQKLSQRMKMLTATVTIKFLCWNSLWYTLHSCFPASSVKCFILITLLWADGFQSSGFLNLGVWEIALQCLLSKILNVAKISQGVFYLLSSFGSRNGIQDLCMPHRCTDPELHV